MDLQRVEDAVMKRVQMMNDRVHEAQQVGLYHYNQPITEMLGGSKVLVRGREMDMFASYSYSGLIGHPRINEAAKKAIDDYGTGTHGVRSLAGSLDIHFELERTIADFKKAEDAITYSSGYVTNLTVVSTLLGRHDSAGHPRTRSCHGAPRWAPALPR